MNCVRKHLSRIKGGRLAQAFPQSEGGRRELYSLIISDVVGDPLDVIASGPTAADPTTFADAMAVLDRFKLREKTPPKIVAHLEAGAAGRFPETLKELPSHVHNLILGNNSKALAASQHVAESLGYRVLNLGSFIEGDTQEAAIVLAGIVRSIRVDSQPLAPPVCVLSGGETTVTLPPDHAARWPQSRICTRGFAQTWRKRHARRRGSERRHRRRRRANRRRRSYCG